MVCKQLRVWYADEWRWSVWIPAHVLPWCQHSRHHMDVSDWELLPSLFHRIQQLWPSSCDLFASCTNYQLPTVVSWRPDSRPGTQMLQRRHLIPEIHCFPLIWCSSNSMGSWYSEQLTSMGHQWYSVRYPHDDVTQLLLLHDLSMQHLPLQLSFQS